jgi:hypothetical protein
MLENYRTARSLYSSGDFAKFFELSGIEAKAQQGVFMDVLCAAGAAYLSEYNGQTKQLPKGKVLEELNRAQNASDELVKSLEALGKNSNILLTVSEAAVSQREDILSDYGKDSDTYQILGSIFPFDIAGNGFRQSGLQNSLKVLSKLLASIQTDQIQKTKRGRLETLKHWVSTVSIFWVLAKGALPTSGHYDQGTGDYDSPDVAALTFAIEKIDTNISSRLVAEALRWTSNQFRDGAMEAMLHYGAAMTILIGSGETYTHKENLKMFFQMASPGQGFSDAKFDEIWGSLQKQEPGGAEQAYISKEQFHETLNSSDSGKMLLQAFVEMIPK